MTPLESSKLKETAISHSMRINEPKDTFRALGFNTNTVENTIFKKS